MKRIIATLLTIIYCIGFIHADEPKDSSKPCCCESPVKFTWGGDIGSSIDMTGNDMSSVIINAMFGLRFDYIDFIGGGVGTDVSVSNSCRSFPIFGVIRSSFAKHPKLMFFESRVGCSINYLQDEKRQSDLYVSAGPGIRLASNDKFSSYLSMSYTLIKRHDMFTPQFVDPYKSLHFVTLRLGVTF